MAGATRSVKGVLVEFPTPILPKIGGEPTREGLSNLHRLVSVNMASVVLNLGGGRHRHLALTMTRTEYTSQMGFDFVPQNNPGDYIPTMGTAQEQALVYDNLRQNQALFRKYTAIDGAFKNRSSWWWNQYSCINWRNS